MSVVKLVGRSVNWAVGKCILLQEHLFADNPLDILTVNIDDKELCGDGWDSVVGLADVGAHVLAADVRDVEHAADHVAL